jgi:tetratricopeptide (TPR) repeat protein/Mn-dependent DtxR family transcriptional regulator
MAATPVPSPAIVPLPQPNRPHRRPSPALAEAWIGAWLEAHRSGTLAPWLAAHPRLARRLATTLLAPVLGTLGEGADRPAGPAGQGGQDAAAPLADRAAHALTLWLRWALSTLRPDRASADAPIDREHWLSRTSWRPLLALQCHFGFEPVPAFRDRYRAAPDEPPASQLCGLWSIGASTYYRHIDKAREALAARLRAGVDGPDRLALRAAVARWTVPAGRHDDPAAAAAWHRQQAERTRRCGDAATTLWHLGRAGALTPEVPDPLAPARAFLRQHLAELANTPEAEYLMQAALARDEPAERFEALLLQCELRQLQGQVEAQRALAEQALREAHAADDPVRLGRAACALGRYHEPRDTDRAFALFEDAADALWRAGADRAEPAVDAHAPAMVEAYAEALVRLGWLLGLRNDPRARITLERVEALRERHTLAWSTLALLEQTWGEYWRRAGEPPRALSHMHRAMNLHERSGNAHALLKACCNLALLYGEIRDFPRAVEHSRRVLSLASVTPIEPQLRSSTLLNLGAALFWQDDLDGAEAAYREAQIVAQAAGLALNQGRAHYNLAEVAYLRFKATGDAAHERAGDAHTAAALAVWPHGSDPAYAEATQQLKGVVLAAAVPSADRLVPQESLLHPAELAQVAAQREALAAASSPDARVAAHLRIAEAYLTVALKEREAARALMRRHELSERFDSALQSLQATWSRELDREATRAAQWTAQAADLLGEARCRSVLAALATEGVLRKRRYAEAAGVSPATASKHLAALVARGLLEQSGKGPATRYRLKDA